MGEERGKGGDGRTGSQVEELRGRERKLVMGWCMRMGERKGRKVKD